MQISKRKKFTEKTEETVLLQDYEFVMYDRVKSNLHIADGVLHLQPFLLADAKGEEFLYKGEIDLNTYP